MLRDPHSRQLLDKKPRRKKTTQHQCDTFATLSFPNPCFSSCPTLPNSLCDPSILRLQFDSDSLCAKFGAFLLPIVCSSWAVLGCGSYLL
ncbi:hypothetical protein MLD38_008029 [Melastoma candidum]|uniref:Uncharacterized protein n=1 Tax=Melastoma candidum TaxID=119954 RepID=A0ACB9RSQ2_9MYRT|nr:hypothetical protein MLD38_008029 [Melastoma candidum]